MTIDEKKAKVMQHLIAAEMILPEDQEEYLASFISSFDGANPEYKDLDKYEKAYAMICNGGKYEAEGTTALQDITSVEPRTNVTKPMESLISTDELNSINAKLESMKEFTDIESRSTKIDSLIVDRPSTSELFVNINTFIPDKEKSMRTLAKYKNDVVEPEHDGELKEGELSSRERYNKLVAAVEAGEPIEIAKSNKLAKIVGATLTIGDKNRKMNMNNLTLYVATSTSGYILADAGRPGCELTLSTKKASKSNPDAPKESVTYVRFKNRKETEEAKNIEIASKLDDEMAEYSVRSKINFKVYATDANGNRKTITKKVDGKLVTVDRIRTISLTGTVTAGKLVRKEEYKDEFPVADPVRASKGLEAPVGKKAEELRKKHIESIAALVRSMKGSAMFGVSKDLADKLKEFDEVLNNSKSSAVGASY